MVRAVESQTEPQDEDSFLLPNREIVNRSSFDPVHFEIVRLVAGNKGVYGRERLRMSLEFPDGSAGTSLLKSEVKGVNLALEPLGYRISFKDGYSYRLQPVLPIEEIRKGVDRDYIKGLIGAVADTRGLKPFLKDMVLKKGLFDGIDKLPLQRKQFVRLITCPMVQERLKADAKGSQIPFKPKYFEALIDAGVMVGEMNNGVLVYGQDDALANLSVYYAYWMKRFAANTQKGITGVYDKTRESVVEMFGSTHPLSNKILNYHRQNREFILDFDTERNKLATVDSQEIADIRHALRRAISSDAITAYDSISMARLMQKTGNKEWFVYEAVFKIGQLIKSIQDTKNSPAVDIVSINYSEYLDYLTILEKYLSKGGQNIEIILHQLESKYEDVVKMRQQINQPDISNIKDYN